MSLALKVLTLLAAASVGPATGCKGLNDSDCAFRDTDDGLPKYFYREKRSEGTFYQTGKELAKATTATLDNLLGSKYDKRIRPGFGRRALVITLNLSLRSMGPVDEMKQAFALDCYFRQSWRDDRLEFNASGVSELPLNWQFLNKIWKPDTFFLNGKKSKLHKLTVPNRFLRITPDGTVSYSQRLTVRARCQMNLRRFPMDKQMCSLLIGSYGYSVEDVIYEWKANPVSFGEIGMAQFHLTKWNYGINTNMTNRKMASGFRNDSVAFLQFYFERQTGFFVLQIYTPLILVVMCSWVAFWIVRTDAPARCCLGIMTVLSVTTIGFSGKGKPQVGYPTAMDVFTLICFASVFAAILEFAAVNFITTFIARYKAQEAKERELLDLLKATKDLMGEVKAGSKTGYSHSKKMPTCCFCATELDEDQGSRFLGARSSGPGPEDANASADNLIPNDRKADKGTESAPRPKPEIGDQAKFGPAWFVDLASRFRIAAYRASVSMVSAFSVKPIPEMYIYTNTEEAVASIDEHSRKGFPLAFLFMMVVYWSTYLYFYRGQFDEEDVDGFFIEDIE